MPRIHLCLHSYAPFLTSPKSAKKTRLRTPDTPVSTRIWRCGTQLGVITQTTAGPTLSFAQQMFLTLLLTFTVSVVTFASGPTNILQGSVHLVLFAAYVLLIAQG